MPRNNEMGMSVVMLGNPIDGVRIVGPFTVPSEAIEWATNNAQADWWTTPLESPEGFSHEG